MNSTRYLPSPTFNRFDKAALEIMKIATKYVEKAAADLKLNPGKEGEKSVLEKLILSNNGELDIPVVMAIDGMMAGIDTTGNTVSFLLYHLAINPEVQERLYEEIKKEIGQEGPVTEAGLKRMKYLKACLQATILISAIVDDLEYQLLCAGEHEDAAHSFWPESSDPGW